MITVCYSVCGWCCEYMCERQCLVKMQCCLPVVILLDASLLYALWHILQITRYFDLYFTMWLGCNDQVVISIQFLKLNSWTSCCVVSVASPGFVTRRGKAGNLVIGHSRRTSGPGAAAFRWLIVLWLMQYWSKELWVVDIYSHRLHNTCIVGSHIYSKVN